MRFNKIICNVKMRTTRRYKVHMTSQKYIKYNVDHRCQLCNQDFRNISGQKIFSLIKRIPFSNRTLAPGHLNIAAYMGC